MLKRLIRSPMFWSASVLGIAMMFHHFLRDEGSHGLVSDKWHQLPQAQGSGLGWLIKPFLMPAGDSRIALDGGEIPLLNYGLPELRFGPESRHPLHLVLLVDWHADPSRRLLRSIQRAYESDTASSFPPLMLSLLPSGSTAESKEAHELLGKVYTMTSRIETFPSLVRLICQDNSPFSSTVVEDFLREDEPGLFDRIRSASSDAVNDAITAALSSADAQRKRNSALLDLEHDTQLVSMYQVLTTALDDEQFLAFVSAAKAMQDAYLSSPQGLTPIAPGFGCDCKVASHVHQSWKPAIAARFPEFYLSPDSQMAEPDPLASAAPQIRFLQNVHVTESPQSGEAVTHSVHFENTGGADLEISEIVFNSDFFTLLHWDRQVPPGSRGSFTVRVHSPLQAGSAQSIWVATNSVAIEDARYGHEVILRVPAGKP